MLRSLAPPNDSSYLCSSLSAARIPPPVPPRRSRPLPSAEEGPTLCPSPQDSFPSQSPPLSPSAPSPPSASRGAGCSANCIVAHGPTRLIQCPRPWTSLFRKADWKAARATHPQARSHLGGLVSVSPASSSSQWRTHPSAHSSVCVCSPIVPGY